MRNRCFIALALALGLCCVAKVASAQIQHDYPSTDSTAAPEHDGQLTSYPSSGYRPVPVHTVSTTGAFASVNHRMVSESWVDYEGDPAPAPGAAANGHEDAGNCLDGCCDSGCGPFWYVGAAGLFMDRDRGNPVWLSWDGVNLASEVLNTRDAPQDMVGGYEIRLGRQFDACTALEATYYGLGIWSGAQLITAGQTGTGQLNSSLDFNGLTFGGAPVDPFWATGPNGAHFVRHSSEFHNVEVNYIWNMCGQSGCSMNCGDNCGHGGGGCDCDECRRYWCCTWMFGMRFVRFWDCLLYATSQDDAALVGDANEAFYQVNVENNLIGAQIGARLDFYPIRSPNLALFAIPRIGMYGNTMNHRSQVFQGDLTDWALDVNSSKTDVSMLGQLDLGVDWYFACNWKFFGGYRIIGITGIGLSEEQVPTFVADVNGIADIDSNADLIVHGGFFGIEYTW